MPRLLPNCFFCVLLHHLLRLVLYVANMSESQQPTLRFFNYPTPKPHDAPYQAPPPGNNPVVKGALLNHLSTL